MGGIGAAILLLFAAPFILAFIIFLIGTRNSEHGFVKAIRMLTFGTIAAVILINGVQGAIADFQKGPDRHILHIRHEFAAIEGCEPAGTEAEPTTLVTIAFETDVAYAHPVPVFKDKNYFERMKLVQISGRVVTEDGQRNRAEGFFPLPLDQGRVATDQVVRGTVEVPGHGTCEIDHVIAREVEPIRYTD